MREHQARQLVREGRGQQVDHSAVVLDDGPVAQLTSNKLSQLKDDLCGAEHQGVSVVAPRVS